MTFFLPQAKTDSALWLSNIVLVASPARTERLLQAKQSLYLQLSQSSTGLYEKLKLFHSHKDENWWRSPRGPIPIPIEAVALDFTVLENVLEPVVSFRALLRTFDDADPEIDGFRQSLSRAEENMRVDFDVFKACPYSQDPPFPFNGFLSDVVLESRLGPVIPALVMGMERKGRSATLLGLDDPLEYLHVLTSLVMEAQQTCDILETASPERETVASFVRVNSEEAASVAARDLSPDARHRWEESLRQIPEGHRHHPSYLLQFSAYIFKLQGAVDVADFDDCVSFFLRTEYQRTGNLTVALSVIWHRHINDVIKVDDNAATMNAAITITQHLLDTSELDFRPAQDLACLLIHRYSSTLERSDLERAQELLHEPPAQGDETEYYGFRCMLADRLGVSDVEAAEKHADLCATDPPFRRLCLDDPMGAALLLVQRFFAGGQQDIRTLDEMISLLEPLVNSGNVIHRLTLADTFHRRGGISGDPQELHKVVDILLPLLSKDESLETRDLILTALLVSDSLYNLARMDSEPSKSLAYFTQALNTLSHTLSLNHPFDLFPQPVFDLVRLWVAICTMLERSDVQPFEAAHFVMLQKGINAFTRIVHLEASFETRASALSNWQTTNARCDSMVMTPADFVSYAVATAFMSGQPMHALEWLEQGRSVLWRQMRQLRAPLGDVKVMDLELWREMDDLRRQLLVSSSRGRFDPGTSEGEAESRHHRKIAQAWQDAVLRARRIPGLEQFLLPTPISELLTADLPGPVVVINCYERTDAIILLPAAHGVERSVHVHLEGFSAKMAQKWHEQLVLATRSDFAYRSADLALYRKGFSWDNHVDQVAVFRDMLLYIWKHIVIPVLAQLNISTYDKEPQTTIYWCPTGELTFLPIHAAGDYTKTEKGHKVYDFVASSYTPNVSSLLQPVLQRVSGPATQLLTVAVAAPNGQAVIHGTDDEIMRISREVMADPNCEMTTLSGQSATLDNVTAAMRKASWIHFACHGVQSAEHPLESALLLSGSDRLRLSDIISLDLPTAELAFLSACQTATGIGSLPSESMHLGAGMNLAGFRSVIATLWSIADSHAPEVAAVAYQELLKDRTMDQKTINGAQALHKAVEVLRKKVGYEDFLAWVPYIHIGI